MKFTKEDFNNIQSINDKMCSELINVLKKNMFDYINWSLKNSITAKKVFGEEAFRLMTQINHASNTMITVYELRENEKV